jgi:hypothetical protein
MPPVLFSWCLAIGHQSRVGCPDALNQALAHGLEDPLATAAKNALADSTPLEDYFPLLLLRPTIAVTAIELPGTRRFPGRLRQRQ